MLDFSKLRTPTHHGDILVAPDPADWLAAANGNADALRGAGTPLCNATLGEWRRKTREAIAGRDDRLLVVTGHQPGFIHPGGWAKHILAARFAEAVRGLALSLVVDADAAKQTGLSIPVVNQDRVTLERVSFFSATTGHAYEQIRAQTPEQIERLRSATAGAMGDRFDGSQMPAFFDALAAVASPRDWVDQVVAARRTVEADLGVVLDERRVSKLWCTPLLADMLANAPRFAQSYNSALAAYRRANRVRGRGRPIPDLIRVDDRCEVPVWVYRANQPRRRLLVARRGDSLRLFADDTEVAEVSVLRLPSCDGLEDELHRLGGWKLRPRALTLTIWARLLLADLFIHGIGGAKYDRISNAIMADYYGVHPPQMACVTATLWMDLPGPSISTAQLRRLRAALRDLEYNPQRNLPPGRDLAELIEQREQAVRRSVELRHRDHRNRAARRTVFAKIRDINASMLALRRETVEASRTQWNRALQELQQEKITSGREYFFALYDRTRLEQLLHALPAVRDFRV